MYFYWNSIYKLERQIRAELCSVPQSITKSSPCPRHLAAHRNDAKLNCKATEWPPPPQELLCHVWNPAENDGCATGRMQAGLKAQQQAHHSWLHLGGTGSHNGRDTSATELPWFLLQKHTAYIVCKDHWRSSITGRNIHQTIQQGREGHGREREGRGIWNRGTCLI